MRFSISAITLLSVILQKSTTFAFTPNSIIGSTFLPRSASSTTATTTSTATTSSSTSTTLYMAEEKKKLTAADILARARKSVNNSQVVVDKEQHQQQEEEEEPEPEPDFLFEDDILEEFQKTLVILEKRVKEGPNSLSVEEVTALEASASLIVKDMEDHLNTGTYVKRDSPFAGTKGDATIAAGGVATPPPVAAVTPPPTPPPVVESQEGEKPLQYAETNDEEGEAYAGKGGLGMAKGTRNTYVIPGMDEMDPEEYRAALQKSVSDRQRKRRQNRDGLVGNRSALQYLDQLGYGGAADNWKIKEKDDTTDTNESVQQSSTLKKMERMSKPSEYRTISQQPSKTVEAPKTSYDSYTVPPETDLYEQPAHSETHALVDKVLEEEGPKLQYAETSDEEGEAYNGKGGLGMAKGTRNTYVIPGMDEMSPEEYRAALQKSVSDRQRKRRQNRDGLVGNRSALQYLDQLGYGGAADNWKTKEDGAADE